MKIAVVDVSLRELVSGALRWQEVDPAEFDYATENVALERLG